MQIQVNGENMEIAARTPLAELIQNLDLTGRFAVEVNEEIIPRSQLAEYRLQDGDKIEIVHAVGGG